MDTSNMEQLCCISKKNKELQSIIEQQTSTIGVLLQEKNSLMEQYQNLLISLENTSNVNSNI